MSRAARFALAGVGLVIVGCGGMDLGGVNIPANVPVNVRGVPVGGVLQTGGLIASSAVDMDEPEEVELGRATTAAIGSRYALLRDEALTRYVALVGNAVAQRSERPDMRYYFAVLDADDVNALAAPGGYVFVTRGALAIMRDEATLAGVLGHEVGHIALRHHDATIKAAKRKAAFVSSAQTTAVAFNQGQWNQLIGLAADAVVEQTVIKGHSRGEESASDSVGFRYAAAAGYDPAGLRDFFKTLQDRGGKEQNVARFFSTHPGTDERLREQDALLQKSPPGGRRNVARFQEAMARLQKPGGAGRQN